MRSWHAISQWIVTLHSSQRRKTTVERTGEGYPGMRGNRQPMKDRKKVFPAH
jgi:hypothetical protein